MVMAVDIGGFSGIFRLLMKLFNSGHLLCFFRDLDSVSRNEVAVVNR